MWLKGVLQEIPKSNGKFQVNPYHHLAKNEFLSKKRKNNYNLQWTPIMTLMMDVPGVVIPGDRKVIMEKVLSNAFNNTARYLQERQYYIFKNTSANM